MDKKVANITYYMYTTYMTRQHRIVLADFFTPIKFSQKFKNEKNCEDHLFSLKYSQGFQCASCSCKEFYRLKRYKNRVFQCKNCGKQESLTANTIFQGTRTPLFKCAYSGNTLPPNPVILCH